MIAICLLFSRLIEQNVCVFVSQKSTLIVSKIMEYSLSIFCITFRLHDHEEIPLLNYNLHKDDP